MRLWTIQGIEIYEQMQKEGYAYCTKPSWGDDAGEAPRVLLKPQGSVAAHAVLPRAKPQEDHPQLLLAGAVDDAVYECEVVPSLFRLDKLPIGGHEHGVEP